MASNKLYGPNRSSAVVVAANAQAQNAGIVPALQTVLTTAETVIADPSIPANALICSIPPGGPTEQRPFDLVASGYLNNGTSSTVTIKVYSGTSLTPGSDTLLGSSGAITAFVGKAPWYAKATLIYDSVSGKLQGTIKFVVNNILVAEVAVSNVVTALNNANNPVANFVLSVTWGTAGTQVINVQAFDVNF